MSTAASGLRELHQMHIRLRQVQDDLQRGPKQVEARKQFTQRKLAELEAQKEHLTTLRKAADEKSLQLKTNESKIADLKLKLNTANSNKEFDIFKGQIDADTMANSVLEDEILELLEKIDQAQVACGQLKQTNESAKSEENRVSDEVAAAEPSLKQQLALLEAAISEAVRMLPADVAVVYRRLIHAHGSGALAPVENNACGACHVGLSPQSRVELNSGKIIFCKPCGRLLYLPEGD